MCTSKIQNTRSRVLPSQPQKIKIEKKKTLHLTKNGNTSMGDSYGGWNDRHNRRRRRREYGRHGDDASPTPPSNKPPPVTILGLAKPSKPSTSSTTEADDLNIPESGGSQITDGNTLSYSETSSAVLSSADKCTPSSLLSSDNKSRVTTLKSHGDGDNNSGPEQQQLQHRSSNDDNNSSTLNDDNNSSSHSSSSPVVPPPQHPPKQHRHSTSSVPSGMISGVIDQGAQTHAKLAPPPERQAKMKLIDDGFQWCDAGLDLMLEQTDFVVVGIVGLQGCGKSTLLSLLAGNSHQDAYRNYFFYPQTKETKEDCLYQTSGVDMFVTPERVILLDSQPLLSAAVMDCQLRYERKFPSEFSSLHNFMEMQSMQLLTFMMSVCNILLVADDYFLDVNFFKFVMDAEMLKPSTQPASSSSSSASDPASSKDGDSSGDFYPTVIFVHNKASKDDFNPSTYNLMQHTLNKIFETSKLKMRSGINMLNNSHGEAILPRLSNRVSTDKSASVNLLMLPLMEFYKSEPEWLQTTLPEYRGYPSFNTLLAFYRAQILSAQRSPVTANTLSEKNWYHFAARMWESVKKSPLLAEYNRLLS